MTGQRRSMLNSFSLALKSIWANKMRSFLTMLGIIIGVAAVIILIGIVNGQMNSMMKSFTEMGTNRINVNCRNMRTRYVEPDQMYKFFDTNQQYFTYMSPTVTVGGATVKVGNENTTSTSVTGVSEDYIHIVSDDLELGRFIQFADIAMNKDVAVVGYYVGQTYYNGAAEALGKTISVNGHTYRIVGVMERKTEENEKLEEGGSDDYLYLPYSSAADMTRSGRIGNYTFCLRDDYVSDAATVKLMIENYLYTIFKNTDLYTVTAMSEMLKSLNTMLAGMSLMLGGIAGISLLVAGVGVMNIMLVSVTERTREIGIRKALGAKRSTILMQFVIEAAVTSSLGGVMGIAVGYAGSGVAGTLMKIDASPTAFAVIISFSVSVVIGLIFGYAPARRAAALNPIDALRSD